MFPIKKQLRRYYTYAFFSALRVTSAVWVILLAGRGFALWQIGLAEGVFHGVSLLAEVPSGMAADLLGRRHTLALSGVLGAASALAMAVGANFGWVCLSMVLSALSYNLISGTQEAILYDSLVAAGQEGDYFRINARSCRIDTIASAVSDLCSTLAAVLSYCGFYLLDAGVSLTRTLCALSLKEPIVTKTQAARQKNPFAALPARLRAHVAATLVFLRGSPATCKLIFADAAAALPCYLTLMYLQQRLAEQGVPTALVGPALLVLELSRLGGNWLGLRLHRKRLLPLFAGCLGVIGLGTFGAGAAPVLPALGCAMAACMAGEVFFLHVQKRMNDAFPSDQRATLVSVDSMVYSVLMILASPLTGWAGDTFGGAGAGLCLLGGGLLALAAAAALAILHRRRAK